MTRYLTGSALALALTLPAADWLFRYLDEENFRYNERKHADGWVKTDGERFVDVTGAIGGKRLTYKKLTGKTPGCPSAP